METKPLKNEFPYMSNAFNQEREQLHFSVLSSVSHDLKTPISCIIGALEIYERTKGEITLEKSETLLNTALQEAYRLDSFISNILEMARLESGSILIKKELCVMELLLEDCLIHLGKRLSGCDVQIIPVCETFTVITDPVLLGRAICILLDSAARYCTAHSRILVEYEKLEQQVIIRIIYDTNFAASEPKAEYVSSKYSRLSQKDHQHAGAEFGLVICREIIRLLGGCVTVGNNIFTIEFAD